MNPSAGAILTSCNALTDAVAVCALGKFSSAIDTVPGRADAPANQNRATPATATEIASPLKDSHMPGQRTTSPAAAMDHQKKDGKQ